MRNPPEIVLTPMPLSTRPADTVALPAGFETLLGASHDRLCQELVRRAPDLCEKLLPWMHQRAAKGLSPTAYFTHPLAFPLLLLPWWLDESLGAAANPDLQSDLMRSSMSGYYLIRLIDDVMDRSPAAEPGLLPAVAVLHAQFQSAYARWFPSAHPFWEAFHAAWARCNEAAVVEAGLSDIDERAFASFSAPKVSAAIIPMLAVAWQRNSGSLPPAWAQLFPKLCAFHQRYNDLFDWKRDLDSGAVTHFLCQGRNQLRAGESMFAWVAREGFAQEARRLRSELLSLQADASRTRSPSLCAWLRLRRDMLDSAAAEARAGFDAAEPLLRALQAQTQAEHARA
jgi:hypothetical protein